MGIKSLKIGIVLDDSLDRPDGVQQYVLTIGRWLQQQGHIVHYIVSTTSRHDIPNLHAMTKNMTVRFNGNQLRMPLPARQQDIRKLLQREDFDVLHIQMPFSPFLAGRIIKAADKRTAIVGTFHIVPNSRFVSIASRILAVWCRSALRRFDAVMSVSDAAKTFAKEAFGIDSIIVSNAFDFNKFQKALPRFKPDAAAVHILFLGRLVPRKGCLVLLQAIALLKERDSIHGLRVSICGRGPLLDKLKEYVDRNGLAEVVTFTGFIKEEDKPDWFASSDITVFPSSGGESFGIVVIEAMASARAVVLAGDNSGYRSILSDCPFDVLFDPNDIPALADKIQELLPERSKRKKIAAWQSNHAEQYDVPYIGKGIVETYKMSLQARLKLR